MGRIVEVLAPAKINLTLHVTGQRADGYHLLDSLVVFARVGDRLRLEDGGAGFTVTGPFASGVPRDARNFVAQVLSAFAPGHRIGVRLEKNLPAAAGIGGGSADAAAAFRGLQALYGRPFDAKAEAQLLSIGADVPMCVASHPVHVSGIGEKLSPFRGLPPLAAVLINPGVEVATPAVFKALTCRNNPPMPLVPTSPNAEDMLAWLTVQRNDLEAPARARAPVIADCLDRLRDEIACRLARMSGSGATVFGLFEDLSEAEAAALRIRGERPDWWVRAATLDGGDVAAPQLIRSTT